MDFLRGKENFGFFFPLLSHAQLTLTVLGFLLLVCSTIAPVTESLLDRALFH